MQFSDTVNNTGIVQQTRQLMRVDSSQWATSKIVNSVNNYLDTVAGYAIGADRRFQWDDTNHTKLPIGTTNLVASQSDYSFLTDEQGNRILTLTRIDVQDKNGDWVQLKPIDQFEVDGALTLGLQNLQPLSIEMDKEKQKMIEYFLNRNNDSRLNLSSRGARYNFN